MQKFATPVVWLIVIVAGAVFISPFILAAALVIGTLKALAQHDRRNR